MSTTQTNRQARTLDQQPIKPHKHLSAGNARIIPFPEETAPRPLPATGATGPRIISLPLRQALREVMEPVLQHARTSNKQAGCLVLEIDSYREIEETFGYQLAEEFSALFENRLMESLRDEDVVYQVDHNEYVILLDCIEERGDAASIAERLFKHCTGIYQSSGVRLPLKSRIGMALYPTDSAEPETLLRYARVALREDLAQHSEHCHFFAAEQLDRLRQRMFMATEIKQAMEQNRVVLQYQPQYAIDTQRVIGVEALVRLRSESGEIIPPNDFIELAEDTGLIVPLGRWVLEEACQQLARWRRAGSGPLRMAVNISPRQLLEADFIDIVDQAVASAGIRHADLELEITERQIVEHITEVEQTLRALAERGVRMAIDDFGTGYSSLAYLVQLSVQTVKIDRTFMSRIPAEERAGHVVNAIISMAKALGMTMIAEGIETAEQHQFLLDAGCELGQGFGFAKPQFAREIERYLF